MTRNLFIQATADKAFGTCPAKMDRTKKTLISTFAYLLTATAKFKFREGRLVYAMSPARFENFSNNSQFPKIFSLKSFDISGVNSYTKLFIVDIKVRLTCGE